jgi:HEAT repeat protein
MKIRNIIIVSISLMLISLASFSQDKRTLETKVADLLALFPSSDPEYTSKLMNDMLSLGDAGIKMICDQIIPSGTGDDTPQRFAVESFSRYLSQPGKEAGREMWEKLCIAYALNQKDLSVKDFFMKQLQIIGRKTSIEALKSYLSDKELCEPALAVIAAAGGNAAENAMSEALKNRDLPCAASVMNKLALMKSEAAVNDFIFWASKSDPGIKAAAYNALAQSGNPLAYPVLSAAAKESGYKWEPSGATEALINYAKAAAQKGNIKVMNKICKMLISKCNDNLNIHYKTAALDTYVKANGSAAMPYLLDAVKNTDSKYRNAALRMSLGIPGQEILTKWIEVFPKAPAYSKPDIISALGLKKDKKATPLVKAALNNADPLVRKEAAAALVSIEGKESAPALIAYMLKNNSEGDQAAAKSALMTVTGSGNIDLLLPVLKDGAPAAKKTAIEIIAWNRDPKNFAGVLPFTSSSDEAVKNAAFKALAGLAGPDDQEKLITLLAASDKPDQIADIQAALIKSANMIVNPEKRSDVILKSIKAGNAREKLIPVLAKTGGREALATVLKEFEEGNSSMRDICFKALTAWKDPSASSALYEICASKNKTYEAPAFAGYVRQIRSSSFPDEQKLLLFRKIMPFALSADRKNEILTETGKLKTYQALYYVSGFMDDPETSAAAARAAMTIALPSTNAQAGMYGKIAREILVKAASLIAGPEKDYDREMINKYLAEMPADEGFYPMFNGKDLSGWQGLVENPITRAKMKPAELAKKQLEANKLVPGNWSVKDGCIWFSGKGNNLCSIKEYGDFEMLVDWVISKEGDSGLYLRGTPQVQIWDTSRVKVGAQVGSGGLYNNKINPSKPLKVADNPVGDWNTFRITMVGEKVSVWLNGELVVDNVTLENYWDRSIPIFPTGSIELQAHGTNLGFRDIYVREISEKEYSLTAEEKAEGFVALFNGRNLDNWTGNKTSYVVKDNMIVITPDKGSGGNLYTEKEYYDFIFRFEFQLTPGANNGLGIRAPLTGDAAYAGMELQILDNTAPVYAKLQPYQYHGSVYGVIPAKRDYLAPVGEWNYQEVYVKGTRIKITLNGTVIVDGDIAGPRDNGTMDHRDHPGLKNKTGHIGFLGHGSVLKFRNIRIKDLSSAD